MTRHKGEQPIGRAGESPTLTDCRASEEQATEQQLPDDSPALLSSGSFRVRQDPPAVDGYRLLQKVGEGGFGEVFEAEQLVPVRRRVALKVIKQGMDSKEVLARFEAERQALALMEHPGIAKVLDGGLTREGRPFFAMELVNGLEITEYCDRHRLSIGRRLKLFSQVCHAVQHAHQKGVIHRDLKPSNVLVAMQDGQPMPKVIDFGIAKATARPLTEQTLFTRLDQFIGTPEYMSPEQAELSGLDIDTRSDLYSLGVLLYVLLVGALPIAKADLRSVSFDEMRRKIREEEPPKPSARVRGLGEAAAAIAHCRQTDPGQLARRLQGDLDWIVMKVLEKDRTRRYETVNALAMDLERLRRLEPVLAARPTTTYRVGKFVRRHRVGVGSAALVLLLLVAFAAMMTLQATRIAAERDRANLEASTAREVADFLVQLFEVADPDDGRGETITVREVLDAGAERVAQRLSDQPVIQARLMDVIGKVYLGLGLAKEAAPLVEKALELRQSNLGALHLETAASLGRLAELREAEGRHGEEEELARQSLSIREAQLGPNAPEVAESLRALAWARMSQDAYPEAEPLLQRALAIRRASLGEGSLEVAQSNYDLGTLYFRQARYNEAEGLLQRAVASYESIVGSGHPRVRTGLNSLGALYLAEGRLDDAERSFRRALAIMQSKLGPQSRAVAASLNNLAVLLDGRDRPDEAAELLERALPIYERTVGLQHAEYAMALANFAWTRYRQGRLEEARPLYERALAIYETSGPRQTQVATLLRDFSLLLVSNGDLARAGELLERARGIREEAFGPGHPLVAECLADLAAIRSQQGAFAEAEALARQALEIQQGNLGSDGSATEEQRRQLAALLEAGGHPVPAPLSGSDG